MKPIIIRTEMSILNLENLMVTALEGGSNYWYLLGYDAMEIIDHHRAKGDLYIVGIMKALAAGHKIPIRDVENEEEILGYLSESSIQNGVDRMLNDKRPEVKYLLSNGDDDIIADAGDADVIFQYFVLGEIVYG